MASDLTPLDRVRRLAPVLRRARSTFEVDLTGSSMHPTMPDGSRIFVQCDPNPEPAPGDIVALLASNHVVAHRVVYRGRRGRAAEYLITCGDAARFVDAPQPVQNVLGIVTKVLREGKWVIPPERPLPIDRRGLHALYFRMLCTVLEHDDVGVARVLAGIAESMRNRYRVARIRLSLS